MKKISICITYFYQRDNIEKFLNELQKIKKLDQIEILIRNDNPKINLSFGKKFKNLNLKIFNEKKKSLGEIFSLRFLLHKAKSDYVAFIADDDFISYQYFDYILNNKKRYNFYLCPMAIKFRNLKKKYELKNNINLILNLFLKRKINISGTVGLIFKVNKFKNIINFNLLKKYHFDLYLIFLFSNFKNYKILNTTLAFNDRFSSRISSGKINLNFFKKDTINLVNSLNNIFFLKSKYYFLIDYISIIFRDKSVIEKIDFNFFKFLINDLSLKKKINIFLIYFRIYFIRKIKLIFLNN